MRKFDYSFLKKDLIPVALINITSGISELKTLNRLRKDNYSKIYSKLEEIARVQSIKSSNAIEGIITSDERILDIVNHNSAPLNHNEGEIAGYRDALKRIHAEYENIEFSELDILHLHKEMLGYVGYKYGGKYKTEDNIILEIDERDMKRVRFKPISAMDTKEAIKQMILAYIEARDDSSISNLLLIPCVILDFLCIHPFSDGNGRMSRLLSLLLLYKNGYDVGKYVSFEEQINLNKDYYYEALRESSKGWAENENSYLPFIENFLSTLYVCYRELDKRFSVVNGKKLNKTSRIESTVLNSLTPISKAEICRILPDISPTTVEAVLSKMIKDKTIKIIGSGRASRYIHS